MNRTIPILAGALVFAAAMARIDVIALPAGDTALHVAAFALLGALTTRAGWTMRVGLPVLIALALGIEAAQASFTDWRDGSPVDALASVLGAGLGLVGGGARSPRGLALASFLCLAAAAGFDLTVQIARPPLVQALVWRAWREGVVAGTAREPWIGAPSQVAFLLRADGRTIPVLDSSERRALALGPGLWPGRRPGDRGTTIILGHRNGAFAALRDLRPGDRIELDSVSGERRAYAVSGRQVVRWDQSGLIPETAGEHLALVTCFPFGETSTTPWRLIVRAEPL